MANPPENEKAQRYLQQLDEARCAGRWSDVPELCRKVEKHAPHRKHLTLIARSEAQIASYSTQRPVTAASTASSGLSHIIPSLLTAIEEQHSGRQEAFQATVCLGWLHHVLEEPGLAVARLPKDIEAVVASLTRDGAALTGWSRVCIVKCAYLKGSAQEKTNSMNDAVASYSSIISWLSFLPAIATESVQFKLWAENLLIRLCQLSDQSMPATPHTSSSNALRIYRLWAKFCDSTMKQDGLQTPQSDRYRRLAWKAYYDTLSTTLQRDLAYEPQEVAVDDEKSLGSFRLRQRAELKRVETMYENLLIRETKFPKASESNKEIEMWVESVISNWRLLCGPRWDNSDLGEGGKGGVGRSVLDILYRAATKTFHSTQILRYLFVVHASLAEFDLAFKAYDSYIEIMTRGKDRAEKSGEEVVDIDDDSTMLRTSSEAVRILCRFGTRKEAEKAEAIARRLEKLVNRPEHAKAASDANSTSSSISSVDPSALAAAYRAIGIGQAHWTKFTYDVDLRAGIQAKAVQYLRRSLQPSLGESDNLDTLYALAVVLAESRDIPSAIKVVKKALSSGARHGATMNTDGLLSEGFVVDYARERKLIAHWHLLALLLTSRSEFTAAEKACEAAFGQFGDPAVLFGTEGVQSFRSEHLNDATGAESGNIGIVDCLEDFEKSAILQIKMTQLSLIEVTEGPAAAVDGCDELLALYGRLLGTPESEHSKPVLDVAAPTAPKTATGGIRGSIFRGRGSVRTVQNGNATRTPSLPSSTASTALTNPGITPAIQVTEDGTSSKEHHHHHHLLHHHKHQNGNVKRSSSKLHKRTSSSPRRTAPVDAASEVPPLPDSVTNGTPARNKSVRSQASQRVSIGSTPRKSVESGEQPLRAAVHNLPHSSPPLTQGQQPPRQDIRLPAPLPHMNYIPPDPQFSQLQVHRLKTSLLVGIWVFISGLYTRANLYEDAREAIMEALKLVEAFETEVASESSTAKALADKGWGGGQSVEALRADTFAARGELLVAQSRAHQARADFERALLHFPDHPHAIVGLSNILLDIYSEIIPLEPTKSTDMVATPSTPNSPSMNDDLCPLKLNRLAARDRAFGLLSTLTKLGSGWDFSEAWYALARAYEESGQIEKTKEVLWWCVELEDTRPIRNWSCISLGGFVL